MYSSGEEVVPRRHNAFSSCVQSHPASRATSALDVSEGVTRHSGGMEIACFTILPCGVAGNTCCRRAITGDASPVIPRSECPGGVYAQGAGIADRDCDAPRRRGSSRACADGDTFELGQCVSARWRANAIGLVATLQPAIPERSQRRESYGCVFSSRNVMSTTYDPAMVAETRREIQRVSAYRLVEIEMRHHVAKHPAS